MEDVVDVAEMLSNEVSNLLVVRDGFETSVFGLVLCWGTFDAAVIHEGPGDVWNFGLKNEGDVFMKNGAGVCPALG